jgi:hypothetical protein
LQVLRQLGTFFSGGTMLPDGLHFAAPVQPQSEGKHKSDD